VADEERWMGMRSLVMPREWRLEPVEEMRVPPGAEGRGRISRELSDAWVLCLRSHVRVQLEGCWGAMRDRRDGREMCASRAGVSERDRQG
jgi:hypothetical protein